MIKTQEISHAQLGSSDLNIRDTCSCADLCVWDHISTRECQDFGHTFCVEVVQLFGVSAICAQRLAVIVHPSWVSQAPRVLSYCADALVFGP